MTELEKAMSVIDFTGPQLRFCEEYLKCWNPDEAYKKVYGKENLIAAKELLRKSYIKKYITERKKELAEDYGLDTTRVLGEIASVAFSDLMDIVEYVADGNAGDHLKVKNKEDLTTAQRKAVKKITVERIPSKYGTRTRTSVEMHDKIRALESLNKKLDIVKDVKQQVTIKDSNVVMYDPSKMTDEELMNINTDLIDGSD